MYNILRHNINKYISIYVYNLNFVYNTIQHTYFFNTFLYSIRQGKAFIAISFIAHVK